MSTEARNWSWKQETSPSEKLVLMAIAEYADDQGQSSFPSQERLAEMTGLSRRTVIRAIGSMVAKGLLTVAKIHGREHSYNLYTLHMPACHQGDTMSQDYLNYNNKEFNRVLNHVTPCHSASIPIPEDFRLSDENRRLAAKLSVYYPPPDSVDEAFKDWALAGGYESRNWQRAAATFIKKVADEKKRRRFHQAVCN